MKTYLRFIFMATTMFVVAFSPSSLFSKDTQTGEVVFSKTFTNQKNTTLVTVLPLKNGGSLSLAHKGLFWPSPSLIWFDAKGEINRVKTLKIKDTTTLSSLSLAPNGDIVALGAHSKNLQDWTVLVLRLSPSGELLWQKKIAGTESNKAKGIVVASNGDIILAGSKHPKGGINRHGWVLRLNKSGKRLWEKTYVTANKGYLENIVSTADGGLLATGYVIPPSKSGWSVYEPLSGHGHEVQNVWVLRLDRQGDKLWDRTLGNSKRNIVTTPVAYHDDFIISGHSMPKGQNKGAAWIARLDGRGKKVWYLNLSGKKHSEFSVGLFSLKDGNIVIGGGKSDASRQNYLWLKVLQPNGKIVSEFKHQVLSQAFLKGLTQLSDGRVIFVGKAYEAKTKNMVPWAWAVSLPSF